MAMLRAVLALLVGVACASSVAPGAMSARFATPVVIRHPLTIPMNVDGASVTLSIAVGECPSEAAASFLATHG